MTMEYALRACVHLAQRRDETCTVQQIARETQVPADYLSKVMRDLCRARLVRSRPGRNGGYALKKGLDNITLYEIVDAVEPIPKIDHCPLNKPCHAKELCPLHTALRMATEAFIASLRGSNLGALYPKLIADLVDEGSATSCAELGGGNP